MLDEWRKVHPVEECAQDRIAKITSMLAFALCVFPKEKSLYHKGHLVMLFLIFWEICLSVGQMLRSFDQFVGCCMATLWCLIDVKLIT